MKGNFFIEIIFSESIRGYPAYIFPRNVQLYYENILNEFQQKGGLYSICMLVEKEAFKDGQKPIVQVP